MSHNGENLDMCDYNTTVESIDRNGDVCKLVLKPVDVKFSDGFIVRIQTVYDFMNDGKMLITRRVLSKSDINAELKLQEYVKASYGFIEYPEDMKDITLYCDGEKVIEYTYRNSQYKKQGGKTVSAIIPEITTEVELCPDNTADTVWVREGNLFSPFFTLAAEYIINQDTKEIKTWLQIKKPQA